MQPYSLDLREKIISTYEAGNTSIRKVAKRFQVSKNTVQSLLQRKQATGTLKPAPATGGKASQLAGCERETAKMVEQHQDYTLAEYCEDWQDKTGVRVSESTMCRFLQKQKLTLKKNIPQCSSRRSRQTSSASCLLADNSAGSIREFSLPRRDGRALGTGKTEGEKP
jgi:putative transposase